jgi:hypothetical protein
MLLLLFLVAQLALAVVQLEAQVTRLAELLANVISDTKGRVEKKQAQVGARVLVGSIASDLASGQRHQRHEVQKMHSRHMCVQQAARDLVS